MKFLGGIALSAAMVACGGQAPPIELTDDEIAWCASNPTIVRDAYARTGAPALEGQDTEITFTVVFALDDGEMLLGSPPPITDEQRNAIRQACRSSFEAD